MKLKPLTLPIAAVVLGACSTGPEFSQLEYELEQLRELLKAGTQTLAISWEVVASSSGPVLATKKVKNPECRGKFEQEKLETGCFVADLNQALEIDFDLKKNFGGDKWRFTEFRLCSGNDESDKSSCSLSKEQQVDFLLVANGDFARFPADGTVDLKTYGDELRAFKLRIFNFTEGEYVYQITACPEGELSDEDAGCAKSDPGGMNRGRR